MPYYKRNEQLGQFLLETQSKIVDAKIVVNAQVR